MQIEIQHMTENGIRSATTTRRQMAGGMALVFGGLIAGSRAWAQQPAMQEKPATEGHNSLTALHYDLDFNASPQRIYAALLDSKQFTAFSGMPAQIDAKPGGAFSMFGGMIVGRNIELVENQRIVQAWRPASWDAGVYSIVRFEVRPKGTGSALAFDHIGFPAGDYDHLDEGWHGHYWEPLKKFLG
jgi:activator of HSP90 ATPase